VMVGAAGLVALILSPGKQPPSPTPVPRSANPSPAQQVPQTIEPRNNAAVPPDPTAFHLYVRGHRVALRTEPNATAAILDRVDNGLEVQEIRREGGWVLVRHPITAKEGWVDARRLSITRPTEGVPEKHVSPKKEGVAKQVLTAAAIARLLIQESVASYPGPCACPYQHDRRGHACGHRSAYSRPGGYAPLCYPQDITTAMVDAYRARID
jgi:hypothetical protein